MKRTLICVIALLLLNPFVFATTFVFKSGKKIKGTVLFEDDTSIRIQDTAGVAMSLNKSSLDLDAMKAINATGQQVAEVDAPVVDTPVPEAQPQLTATSSPVFTNLDVTTQPTHSARQWKERIKQAKQEFMRLANQCKTSGGGSGVLRTDVYYVKGQRVKVTGYWADPGDIARAKSICAKAMEAETAWIQARAESEQFLSEDRSTSSSAASVSLK